MSQFLENWVRNEHTYGLNIINKPTLNACNQKEQENKKTMQFFKTRITNKYIKMKCCASSITDLSQAILVILNLFLKPG